MTPARWERVKQVLDAAWERDISERAPFLDEACAGDPELRAHVEALLASDDGAGDFLDAPAADIAELARTVGGSSEEASGWWIGQMVGRYKITALIGKGGMGAVYRAVRDDDFRMEVAVKLLKRGTDTDHALGRFRAERQILAQLQHPNIARLLDGGATESGLPYFVMEYVHGAPLLDYAASLSIRRRLELFRALCSAVQYAHEHSVIHRDIKPANILVTSEGAPKLLDFGIAKLIDVTGSGDTTAFTGARLMTPEYASPEQVRGERLTAATDVYSLGAVLYELLTGSRAHRIDSYSPHEIESAICARVPQRPSTVNRSLDPDLDNVVMKALRKEPERRYASVAELSEDIGRFLHDMPVKARRESRLYRARKFVKRHRVPIVTAMLSVALVLVVLIVLVLFSGSRGPVTRSIAVLPLKNLSNPEQEYFVEGMTDTLIGELGKIGSLRVISRSSVMPYRNAKKTAASILRELNLNALVEGSVLRSANRVQISLQLRTGDADRVAWTQTYDRDLRDIAALHSDAAKAIAREVHIRLTPAEEALAAPARPVSQQAYEAYLRGRYHLQRYTQAGYQTGIEHLKEALDIDPAYAPAWAALADGYYELSSITLPPSEAMPKARAAAERAISIDPTLPEPHALLAQIQSQYDWRWAASEASLKRALELNPSYAQSHYYSAFYLAQQGRMDEAIQAMAEAYRLDPLPPRRATNLAWVYYLAHRFDEAIARFRKVLEQDPGAAVAHYSLGMAYEQKGQFAEAAAEILKASTLGADPVAWMYNLGHTYGAWGKREQARSVLGKLIKLASERYVNPYYLGIVHLGMGETDRAFESFEKAYQERSEELLFLKVDPRLDRIRSDARYKSLVRRLGLPL